MSILHTMNDDEKARYKAAKLKDVRDHHTELIRDLGISPLDFNMKTQFRDEEKRLVVGIFPSEFKKSKGFYFELVDSDLNPADPYRKVYRVPPSTSFDEEYELNAKGSYLVPLEELRVVNPESAAISKYLNVDQKPTEVFKPTAKAVQEASIQRAPALMEDAPYTEMTIRDYYAIRTGKPVSAKSWLNELIKNK